MKEEDHDEGGQFFPNARVAAQPASPGAQPPLLLPLVQPNLGLRHRRAHWQPQQPAAPATQVRAIDVLRHGCIRGSSLRELVESIVREMLASDKTERCMEQERRRNETKELAVFSRTLREGMHDPQCVRPNMVLIVAQVAFQCRKNRQVMSLRECGTVTLESVVKECTDSITGLLLLHGGPRVARQIQNSARYREFITSMLFLMRAGISFQGRQILPRFEILQQLLPLQVLLPQVFKIRAKSITEGERCLAMFGCCYYYSHVIMLVMQRREEAEKPALPPRQVKIS